MYQSPHLICVSGLVAQSLPMAAILEPGRACGMPNAPDVALVARGSQSLSRIQSASRHENWLLSQPYDGSSAIAISRGGGRGTVTVRAPPRFWPAVGSALLTWCFRSEGGGRTPDRLAARSDDDCLASAACSAMRALAWLFSSGLGDAPMASGVASPYARPKVRTPVTMATPVTPRTVSVRPVGHDPNSAAGVTVVRRRDRRSDREAR